LALFGRAAARDLMDVAALSELYPLERLCEPAAQKDAGFDRRVLADALAAAAAHSDAGFAELGVQPGTVAGLPASTAQWRAQLLDAADMSATDDVQSFSGRTLSRSETPGLPSSRDHLNVIGRHRPTPAETAHRYRLLDAHSRAPIGPLFAQRLAHSDYVVGDIDTSFPRFRFDHRQPRPRPGVRLSVELPGLALLFRAVASGDQLVYDMLASWRGEP
jgi:hypothetical protein